MSNIIQLLERMGQDSELQSNDFKNIITESELNHDLKTALLNKDKSSLEELLRVDPEIVCAMIPAEDEEPPHKEEPGTNEEPKNTDS
ncbi:hypothetical protein [Shewanella sp. YLB-07]|uniref:hypothetical protein n=1 Tax=Shewanella sp. YLB-07 TaxID=2601268 RepID=UPI00128B696F|nr:hypothetical protein [Shewanella sp. YLB-07]MPY23394.1 hypothetical protein [Shewanella sp. YLB-07]